MLAPVRLGADRDREGLAGEYLAFMQDGERPCAGHEFPFLVETIANKARLCIEHLFVPALMDHAPLGRV